MKKLAVEVYIKKVITEESKIFWIVFVFNEDSVVETFAYETYDEIPESYRLNVKGPSSSEPVFCGPDKAHIWGVEDSLYPDFHAICALPEHSCKRCIAESCRLAPESGYKKCKFIRN